MKKYVCGICGYIYDEAAGIPASGISPGTRWEELPENWVCPWCGAPKSAFSGQEPEGGTADGSNGQSGSAGNSNTQNGSAGNSSAQIGNTHDGGSDELRKLSMGELSALCSNLAKGCEKQYLKEEQSLYTKLADYFKDRIPDVDKADVKSMEEMVQNDLDEGFPAAEQSAGEEADRGALRALVWSKKVTNMLNSLLSRYEKEGEAFLEHTNVYVCDICGFVYVGDTPPDICPVCKVPNWKMSKVERRQQR